MNYFDSPVNTLLQKLHTNENICPPNFFLIASAFMPAKRPQEDRSLNLSFPTSTELLTQIDEESERMREEDIYKRKPSRSETVRTLILDGLRLRSDRRQSQQPRKQIAR